MRERLIALRERRAGLLARAEAERHALAGWLSRTDRLARWAGSGASLLGELKRRPLWIAAGAALLFALSPKRVIGWAVRAWSMWQIVRRARVWLHRLAPATAEH
jgi:hypothetical protein